MADPTKLGAFIETTSIYDITQLASTDVNTPEFKQFLIKLAQDINNMALLLNIKDSGYYPLTEFVNGQLFFPDPTLNSLSPQPPTYRQVYRLIVNFGALPNTATKTVAHNLTITTNWTLTRIYGAASDTTGIAYLPLPYASTVLVNNISVDVDTTNVSITTGANRSNYNASYIILEYIKS